MSHYKPPRGSQRTIYYLGTPPSPLVNHPAVPRRHDSNQSVHHPFMVPRSSEVIRYRGVPPPPPRHRRVLRSRYSKGSLRRSQVPSDSVVHRKHNREYGGPNPVQSKRSNRRTESYPKRKNGLFSFSRSVERLRASNRGPIGSGGQTVSRGGSSVRHRGGETHMRSRSVRNRHRKSTRSGSFHESGHHKHKRYSASRRHRRSRSSRRLIA